MSKRNLIYFVNLLLVIVITAGCDSEVKMASRGVYQGPATLTPFMPKATFTSAATQGAWVDVPDEDDPTSTLTSELEAEATGTGTAQIEQVSATLTATAASTSSVTPTYSAAKPTRTYLPETTQPGPSATFQFSTETSAPTWTTEPGSTPIPSNTSQPSSTPLPTSKPVNTSTPVPSNTPVPAGCSPVGNASYESQVIDLINQERTSRGLSALSLNSSLRQAARGHSEDMACNDFFSHTGSDGSTMSSRIIAAGYSYSWAAENIAASSSCSFSASSVVNMWMNSAGHKANILSASAVHIGVGFRCVNDGTAGDLDAYYTANFGAP